MRKILLGLLLCSTLPTMAFAKDLTSVDEMIRQLNSSQMTDDELWKDDVSPNGAKIKIAKKDGNIFTVGTNFLEVMQVLDAVKYNSEYLVLKSNLICIMISSAAIGGELGKKGQSKVIDTVSSAAKVSPVGTFNIVDGFEFYSSIKTEDNTPIITCGIMKRPI
ncbi:hypothetical protein Bresa_00625|uniref:Uncharacterized protein n=1 Tax=Brenneria salicis ATCC 15712 = DSM 30166 TaxID=714314 RepID=A0A366I9R8_9GAMM|nr:hypothetical protein [Brenneria salicis]NMN90549.1 hypothetical protein [Brenneria salicis ATCC 15712 = DSM 30166]RBP64879.1 hypothetical protein DES54_106104 [Brenneria salicis ATCC 15712 = DSM 30166]RLM31595.1 hypothetical protein BHG07_04885 [Brenneria salicis ATCC 15712 = DSM 30166]